MIGNRYTHLDPKERREMQVTWSQSRCLRLRTNHTCLCRFRRARAGRIGKTL